MKKITLLIIFLTAFFANITAQSAGINFTLGFPQQEFRDNMSSTGFGIGGQFNILTPSEFSPVGFGLNVAFYTYGNETRREPFSSTIPDVTVDVERTNNLANFHVLFQVAPYRGTVVPYFEGLFGGSYLFTETKITSRGSQEVASTNNFEDFAWSYGGGAGFMFQVMDSPGENIRSLFIDLKARYLFGSKAKYLQEGSVKINGMNVSYDYSESKTDLLTFHLGVTAFFSVF
jgi:hypothetical protein